MEKLDEMKKIRDAVFDLKESPLYEYRTQNNYFPVLGEGSHNAQIVFIGEAPGKNEAMTGRPFCGASGRVLDKLLAHIGLNREDIYITNIVKDRPENNRDPRPEEIALYAPFLISQLDVIRPKVIATLGRFSMDFIMRNFGLTDQIQSISTIRGTVFKTQASWGEVVIVPLYHPAVAVYNQSQLSELQKDFETLKKAISQ